MDFGWINEPVLDAIEYFTNTFVRFMKIGTKMASIIFLLSIIWFGIQMIFATMESRKMITSIITKFVLFLFLFNSFYPISMAMRKFATSVGMGVGVGTEAITQELASFMQKLETIVEEEKDELVDELNDALQTKLDLQQRIKNANDSISYGYNEKHLLENSLIGVEERIAYTEALIASREKKPSSNEKTIAAIKSVLTPIGNSGEPIEGASLANNYALSIGLQDSAGKETGFLSPSAILRISILTGQIMWDKEWESVVEEWDEKDKKGFFTGMTKALAPSKFPLSRIFDMILTFICMIMLVAATVFALVQYVMCILEYTIITSLSMLFIPCLLFDGLKDMAQKVVPAMVGLIIKLLVITMCMFFATYAFLNLAINTITENTGMNLPMFGYVFFTVILAFVLTQNAPQIAVTMLTGNPQLSMGEVVHAMGTVAAMGAGAVTATKMGAGALAGGARAGANALGAGAGMFGAAEQAAQNAREDGKGGFGTAMAALGGAAQEGGRRVGEGARDLGHKFMNYKPKTRFSGGGGGGAAGGSGSRWGAGAAASATANENEKPDIREESLNTGVTSRGARFANNDFTSAVNKHGQTASFKEFLSQQYNRGKHGQGGRNYSFPSDNSNFGFGNGGSGNPKIAPPEPPSLPPSNVHYLPSGKNIFELPPPDDSL